MGGANSYEYSDRRERGDRKIETEGKCEFIREAKKKRHRRGSGESLLSPDTGGRAHCLESRPPESEPPPILTSASLPHKLGISFYDLDSWWNMLDSTF